MGARQSSSKPRRIASQLLSYGLVGLVTNLAAYLVYLLLTFLAVDPKIAMTILYVLGATLGFFANRKITFRHQGRISTAGGRYFLAQALGYFLNLSLLLVFVDWLGMPHQLVQAAAILIVAGLLFVLYRFYVFPVSAAKSEAVRS